MPSGRRSEGKRTGCLLPALLRKLLLVAAVLFAVFYLALVTGLLSPLLDGIISRAVSSPESEVHVYGTRTDLFWMTSVDSVIVTGADGLVIRVEDSRISGSLYRYLASGYVKGIEVGYLDILLPPLSAGDDQPATFDGTLSGIDGAVVATTGLLRLHYGRICYPDAVLLDSMALETSIGRGPELDLELEVTQAAVQLQGFGSITGSGQLHLDGSRLSSTGFTAEAPPGSAVLTGWIQRQDGRGSIDLTGSVQSWDDDAQFSGWADISGRLEGSIADPRVELALENGGIEALDMEASISADTITFDLDTLRIQGLSVQSDMLSAVVSGQLTLTGMDWSCSAWMDLGGLDLSRLFVSAPGSVLNGSLNLTAYGRDDELQSGSLTTRLRDSRVDTVALDSVYIRLGLSGGTAEVESFIGTPEGNASVTGRCELGAGWKPVNYYCEAVVSLLGDYDLADILGVEGSLGGLAVDVTLSGAGSSLSADGSVSIRSLDYAGYAVTGASWDGTIGIRDGGTEIAGEFAAGDLKVEAGNDMGIPGSSGRGISWNGDAQVSPGSTRMNGVLAADSLALEEDEHMGIPRVSASGLNWDGSIRSSRGSSDLAGTLELASADVASGDPGSAPDARLLDLHWEGSGMLSGDNQPELTGTLSADTISFAGLDLTLATGIDLRRDSLFLPGFVLSDSRDVNLHAEVSTSLGDGIALDMTDIRIGIGTKLKITSDGRLALRLSGDSLFLDTLWLEPPVGLLTASGRFGPADETELHLGLNDIDLTGLMNVIQIQQDFSGVGDLTIDVETCDQSLSACIQGTVRGPSFGKWTQSDSLTVDISITESDLNINGLYIWYDGDRSGLQARIDDIWEDGELSIRPRSLAWLELELNNLGDWLFFALPLPVKTSGAAISARVEYTRGTSTTIPDLDLFVTARIERLFVTSLGMQFPDVTLYIVYPDTTTSRYNSRASLVSGTGHEGTFSIQLLANIVRELPELTVREYQLNASLDHWRTIVLNSGEIELSGHLQSSGEDISVRPEVEGRITVNQGVVSYSLGETSTSSGSGSSELPFDLMVEVVSERGLWFRSSMANIELSADLRILTQSRQLTASGTIQTVRGKVRLLQKDFDITHGSIEVRQGLPPDIHLDIHARTTIRDVMSGESYEIEIVISGDPSNPQILLSGTGPAGILAQEDILSLLAVGLTYGELQQMDSSTFGSELEFVAQSYVGQLLATHIREGIGLDALEITPELLSDSTALTVKVGKYVLPDLYISYTGDFFSQDPGVISAQYYISRDFSLLGSMKSTLNGNQEPSIELHYTLRY